ncbi:MAG: galactokinase [Ruminococcaceae bacterium]|nr:galactokinase [Oscillospiraceae bacterium]
MKASELKKYILEGGADNTLICECAVSERDILSKRERIAAAVDSFVDLYGDRTAYLFSVGGRSEISGNHTDHNRGKVLAAAIDLDIIAVASPTDDGTVTVKSEGFEADTVLSGEIAEPIEERRFTSAAIIAGMERAFLDRGLKVGGFVAYTVSSVLKGSGLSSSAAFEVMMGNILNHLYNGGAVDNAEIAKMAQFAENVYFGKPCGLMDQMACAVGGFIYIDFADPAAPVVKKQDFDLTRAGYSLCITDTGGNHADLNEDYASVPAEMKAVARLFGKEVLREVSEEELIGEAKRIRETLGDRHLMRALHFVRENKRVEAQKDALEKGDSEEFFKNVIASGLSSFRYLQNVYTVKNVSEQGLSVALCLTEGFLSDKGGAWRVHGGGFAGTVQAFVPTAHTADYKKFMESIFGVGSCYVLSVRKAGAVRIV